MKATTLKNVEAMAARPELTPLAKRVIEIINEFVKSGETLVEIEQSDLSDLADLSNKQDLYKVNNMLRNKAANSQFREHHLMLRVRGGHLFLGYREVFEGGEMIG